MSKPVILTGLRANNDLHIGNYFGALLPLVDMARNHADDYDINLFVPDLHSFTTPIDHSQLHDQILHNVRLFAAAGLPLDHPNIHIYRQSYVPAHSELTWILDNFTGFGEMSRMTQFKDKSRKLYAENSSAYNDEMAGEGDWGAMQAKKSELLPKLESRISVGLFNYPVLMAADILLYGATYVPVGDDQTQHLEFARDIAERINNQFGDLFVVPKPVKEQHEFFGSAGGEKENNHQGLRIKDLQDPSKKMSKSDETGKGIIFLGDTPEVAASKIKSAATDSIGKIQYDYANQPGIGNLLDIFKLFGGNPDEFIGQEQYGPFKQAVAQAAQNFLADFQSRLDQVDDAQLLAKLEADEKQMNEVANTTLLKVQKAVGLRA